MIYWKNVVKIVCTFHFSKKKFVEWNCGNDIAEIGGKKKLLQLVCDNAIAEIEGKKKCGNEFVAMALPK